MWSKPTFLHLFPVSNLSFSSSLYLADLKKQYRSVQVVTNYSNRCSVCLAGFLGVVRVNCCCVSGNVRRSSKIIVLGQLLAWLFCFPENMYEVCIFRAKFSFFFFNFTSEKMKVDVK